MATLTAEGHFVFGTSPSLDEFGRKAIANTLIEDGTAIFYIAATPLPTGVMRFNLTPRIYRMLYYNQWS